MSSASDSPEKTSAGLSERDQAGVIDFLAAPQTHGGAEVTRIDTHISHLFLAGDLAYKLKRPVKLEFLDFTTLEAREEACRAELSINRRTAPSIYRDVVPVCEDEAGYNLSGRGRVRDWVVVMNRFDQDALFDHMAKAGRLRQEDVEALALEIGRFHLAAERHCGFPFDQHVEESLSYISDALLKSYADDAERDEVVRVLAKAEASFRRLRPLMIRRSRHGFVRHCHGDLHLRNVVMIDGRPAPFDAIEFSEAISTIDVIHDVSFLIMDLIRCDLRPYASLAMNRYLEQTRDYGGTALFPLLIAMRALIRAMTIAIQQLEGDTIDQELLAEKRDFIEVASDSLTMEGPRMVAIGGLSGVGKSTVARALAPLVDGGGGAVVLRSDAIRKEVFGVTQTTRLPQEAYRPEVSERVYGLLYRRARRVVAGGGTAIVDATSRRAEERDALRDLAARAGGAFTGIWLEAPQGTLIRRLEARQGDVSDATVAVLEAQLREDLGRMDWVRIPATGQAADIARRIKSEMGD